ncbi:hypothetical protein KFL_009970020 [Klebsormidium nitens]|uniref:Uncharacterized protein n=1 Tax=Klebsormidium nitens TaxID=105231 RepID=A0A1Y1INZ0_KLENI|nr:hypothetical protein KFL_009970020 [Klebsormidium nitens]|eukprot:GAQ92373.1 hypothetical protein KFL_009970020 [Klebsormidium nitens]
MPAPQPLTPALTPALPTLMPDLTSRPVPLTPAVTSAPQPLTSALPTLTPAMTSRPVPLTPALPTLTPAMTSGPVPLTPAVTPALTPAMTSRPVPLTPALTPALMTPSPVTLTPALTPALKSAPVPLTPAPTSTLVTLTPALTPAPSSPLLSQLASICPPNHQSNDLTRVECGYDFEPNVASGLNTIDCIYDSNGVLDINESPDASSCLGTTPVPNSCPAFGSIVFPPMTSATNVPMLITQCVYTPISRCVYYGDVSSGSLPSDGSDNCHGSIPLVGPLLVNVNLTACAGASGPGNECAAITTGPSRNGSSDCFCGPHLTAGGSLAPPAVCQGILRAGVPCSACTRGCNRDADCRPGYNGAAGCGGAPAPVTIRVQGFAGICLPNCGTTTLPGSC